MGADPFRVLLIEDNEFVKDLFTHALRRFHKETGQTGPLELLDVTNVEDARRVLAESPVHVAIVDCFLPTMNGTDFIRQLRDDPKTEALPILMVSAGGPDIKKEALEAGADMFLGKPVLLKQLVSTLQALVESRQTGG